MMRYIKHIILFMSLMTAVSGCTKKLASLYDDPDLTTQPSIEKFFTEMLDNNRVRPSYWEMRTFVVMHTGIYTQSVAYLNNGTAYQQNPSYTDDRWKDFYRPGSAGSGVMVHYRFIENAYSAITDEQTKKDLNVFVQAAKVILLDQASQMADLWGDIPFSEAGSIGASGEITMAKFDKAEDVYKYILDGLKTASDYFSSAQLSQTAATSFSTQDILLNGNIDQWRRYANSLRLRLLMRISFYDEARAKTEVLNMLSNPSLFPLIDGNPGYSPQTTDVLLQPLTNYTDNLLKAFTELTNYSAPGYLLDTVMKPSGDPRIPVMFDKYGRTVNEVFVPNIEYNGFPEDINADQQQTNITGYAILDSATFLQNSKLPGVVMTAAEVNLLKAEAYQRWGGGDAQAAYETAVKQSVVFYYYLNSLNTVTKPPLQLPSDSVINNFLNNTMISYTGSQDDKLAKIWVQKWVHFSFLQSVQSWSEYRRTKYPRLVFYPSALPGYELPPSRLVYPSSEISYNPNYSSVKEKDTRNAKIFWDVR